jgi:predicted transcriptional regulator
MTALTRVTLEIPPALAEAMRRLSTRTRVSLSYHYREAVADLLRKYGAMPEREKTRDRWFAGPTP